MDIKAHDYISTACHHGLHVRCRQCCKFCDMPCGCRCHKEEENRGIPVDE